MTSQTAVKDSASFSTGVTFTWEIAANGFDQPVGTYVGYGGNGYNSYNIYKDDFHYMFTDGYGEACYSLYYCLDA
ncbi:hypothetical protein BDZ45DRAFT_798721 [Acephala macrosclerotiorum]|nr:hypothetical protein BDZ45DRAFT_798721 [Acephala macrosclerotiorum]